MSFDSSRLIIITGFARAGTSIVAYILATHPDIMLFIEGGQANVLENNIIPEWDNKEKQFRKMQRIYNTVDSKFITMKRPCSYGNEHFFTEQFKDATFIIMDRNKKDMMNSWQCSSMINKYIKTHSEEVYKKGKELINSLEEYNPAKRKIMTLEGLRNHPDIFVEKISELIGVENNFDISLVSKNGKWDQDKNEKHSGLYARRLLSQHNAFADFKKPKTLRSLNIDRKNKKILDNFISI